MNKAYTVIEVDRRLAKNLEPLGAKRKFWFSREPTDDGWLFKAEERETGEDWAEKIACELCEQLGLQLDNFKSIVSQVPETRMTEIAREFTVQLLLANQKRILNEVDPR